MGTDKEEVIKMSDDLGDRMKVFEQAFSFNLPIRMPVIMRLDGKAFHSFTRGMKKPFDLDFINWMNEVALDVCKEVQNTKLAYIQSDEISLFLNNYENIRTQSWFDNKVQKMVSVAASIASSKMTLLSGRSVAFDARVFILPKDEVVNYCYWRQQDASRNSIQMLARSLYSHKECMNKNCSELQEMIFQKGQNWDSLDTHLKRGRCCVKNIIEKNGIMRNVWEIDNEIPIWKLDGRKYIERFV